MIPFVDLKAQYHSIKEEVDAAVLKTLESCAFTLGPEVADFEKLFAAYCNNTHAMGVNNGTSALHLALLAAGVGPGDEVITVPHTFVASAASIYYTGAKIVLCDIDPATYTMDPAALEAAITPRTKAIIPVHLYGQMADMDPIMKIAEKHGLVVLEDAAQAHGAEYNGRRAGSVGHLAGFSFYPGKNLGAAGEGGAVVTSSDEYARRVKMLRDWGAERKYEHVLKGYNMRLEGMQGAVLKVKMKYIEQWTEMRRAAAKRYDDMFAGTGVQTPKQMENRRHVYHLYVIRTPERARWQEELTKKGIQTGIHYPYPVHLLPAYEDLGYKEGQFPHSEKAGKEVLSLPMYPELTGDMQAEVAEAVTALQKSLVHS
ncbi:DegT/DnrJ/EryC1/StrS family aminotransferase [Hyphomonas sp. WL0036]|uniref:DegT/DnrJ/EryC1/StrS family aminotransferase n=1 Tax=Hyphomonas sediminis TaxID=2866160 RepID=UPI001C7F27A9|nr:DegT/DnrJ/EryC1/StrS family aminotransferase [Hyphomonas sediminis]MBY9067936.1 DegT/DnrJ/EryC1/StrS family aminotransferase [Hyphomonas sediminis]